MSGTLRIGEGFRLPLDLITDRGMVLATTGAGKTYLLRVIAEEALDAGQQVVILDPKGDFWGLRSSEDGKNPGFPIPVFGGEHADLPLEEGSGKFIAELIVEERLSAILDLSLFSKTKMSAWSADFADALYHRNREAMLFIVDEVHTFAPQKYKGREQVLGAFTDVWGKGRKRGIGVLGASQRSALVNKDVLDLTGTMYFLRTGSPRDRDVVEDWLEYNAPKDVMTRIMGDLPGMANGEVWVYSPHTFKILKRGQVRRTKTFDSSATPKPGQAIRKPKTLAEIDVQSVADQMSEAIERAKAEDPVHLRRRVAELQRELRSRPAEEVKVEVPVEVPVLKDDVVERLEKAVVGLRDVASEIMDGLKLLPSRSRPPARPAQAARPVATRHPQRIERSAPTEISEDAPNTAQQKILNALAWLEVFGLSPANRIQVAFVAGYSPNAGHFKNTLGSIRSAGWVAYPADGQVALTPEGQALAEYPIAPGTTEEFHAAVLAKLQTAQRRIVEVCIDAYPDMLSREEVAERSGYSPDAGHFKNTMGSVRSLGLIDYPENGWVVALPVLFPGGHP